MDFVNFCGKKQSQVNCTMHGTLGHCQPKISQLRLLIVPDLIDGNWQGNFYHTLTSKPTVLKRKNDQDVGHSAERRQLPLFMPNFCAPSRKNESARKAGHYKETEQTHGMATPKMLVEEQRQNGRKCGSLNWHLLPCVLSQPQAP